MLQEQGGAGCGKYAKTMDHTDDRAMAKWRSGAVDKDLHNVWRLTTADSESSGLCLVSQVLPLEIAQDVRHWMTAACLVSF